jgi:hypothetical protein
MTTARATVVLLLIALAVIQFVYFQPQQPPQYLQGHAFLFQTPLPEPEDSGAKEAAPAKPETWILANQGGARQSGIVRVIVPPGFTNQSGANVYANMVVGSSSLPKGPSVLPATEFTVGIWPPNDQLQYQQAIEIRLLINAAQVSATDLSNLVLMMYNPATSSWVEQPSRFDPATFELVGRVQRFTPVGKDFPDWGGRSFFCVALRTGSAAVADTGPVANRNANLRAGPGINYAIVGRVAPGQALEPVGRTANGGWLLLDNGAWIAAFLVSNAPELPVARPTPAPSG